MEILSVLGTDVRKSSPKTLRLVNYFTSSLLSTKTSQNVLHPLFSY